ncbi:MAG: glycosyltransferase [Chromatiales bacterium]|nr:glycosyltransferase [Chromatiales bacterium]
MYNNDDPFGWRHNATAPRHHRWYWRHYMHCVPLADQQFVYRPVNVRELEAAGGRNVSVLMPYFVPSLHRPVELTEDERETYGCDAVFVGHYEPDGRVSYLAALVHAGLHVKLFGGGYWTRQVLGELADRLGPATAVVGNEYAKALCGADMCLAFLSRLNRDTYTRRCFEIPACGRLLLCERTEDLRRLFREDEEAVFFSSREELVEKALWLKGHPDERARIAAAGMRRVQEDGHDVTGRMRQMLSRIEALKQ